MCTDCKHCSYSGKPNDLRLKARRWDIVWDCKANTEPLLTIDEMEKGNACPFFSKK